MKNRSRWVTETAIMIALLIVLQAITRSFGQFVTGTCVNFILAISTFICGLGSAVTVAVVLPFLAFMLGIGPALLPIVPGVSLGNVVFVVVLWITIGKIGLNISWNRKVLGLISAAITKFLVLYFLITKVILLSLSLNEKQLSVISASFSWPQLVTAVAGGVAAILVWPKLRQAIKR